jgi:hypothetical protein
MCMHTGFVFEEYDAALANLTNCPFVDFFVKHFAVNFFVK